MTHCVGGNGLQPVIIKVEQHHLRFCCLQDQVSELLHLQTGLERQLQLRAFDHNVGEVKQVNLHREIIGIRIRQQLKGLLLNYTDMKHRDLELLILVIVVLPPEGPACLFW